MVLIISIGEKLDKVTGLMAEAKAILEDASVREQMRATAYLGELGETECLNVALIKAEEAVKILSEHMPEKIGDAQEILDNIHKRLDELNKPLKPVIEEKIVEPAKKKRSRKKKTVVNK